MLNQDETNIHKDSPKEKLTAEVEFDENNLPSDKGNDENDSHHQQQEELKSIARSREKRVQKAIKRYKFKDMVSFAFITSIGDPFSYKDATCRKDSDKWLMEMLEDFPRERRLLAASGIPQERSSVRK